MSRQLVLISHGKFCEELKNSTEMIMGPQENIYTIPLLPEDGADTYKERFLSVTAPLKDYVVLCDLLGGTPANTVSKLIMEGETIELYAGMNLPMVIEFIIHHHRTVLVAFCIRFRTTSSGRNWHVTKHQARRYHYVLSLG